MTVDLRAIGEAHALKIGGYGVHCACGYYFVGFGPNPRTQASCVEAYGWADETLFEHVARFVADPAPEIDVAAPREASRWKYDSQCDVTPETHTVGPGCESCFPHSHRDGSIKWARRFPA